MQTKTEIVPVDGSDMPIYVATPDAPGRYPGVVVMCHITGVDTFTQDVCKRLAGAGYVAASPDVFHYHEWIEDRPERFATLRDTRIVDDTNATLAYFEKAGNVAMDRVAIIGHCMGGRTSLLGAGAIPRFAALMMAYGGRTMISWGTGLPTPFELIRNVTCPVIGLYGGLDQQPSPEDVDKIEAEMRRHVIAAEFHRYPSAGHAFQDHTAANRYNEEASEDAWAKTLAFLDKTLRH
ncbi:MAG: dienelactone hydrolase family protein [Thermomicrobiales bacterium]